MCITMNKNCFCIVVIGRSEATRTKQSVRDDVISSTDCFVLSPRKGAPLFRLVSSSVFSKRSVEKMYIEPVNSKQYCFSKHKLIDTFRFAALLEVTVHAKQQKTQHSAEFS